MFYHKQVFFSQSVSIMTDGPAVMVGRYNGFHKVMSDLAPRLYYIGTCTLHHVSNSVRAACDSLGGDVEKLADSLFSYFHFTNRWTQHQQVQELLDVGQHRFLRRLPTRWLQILPVGQRLLEQLPALKL